MRKKEDGETRYYIDLDLKSGEILGGITINGNGW